MVSNIKLVCEQFKFEKIINFLYCNFFETKMKIFICLLICILKCYFAQSEYLLAQNQCFLNPIVLFNNHNDTQIFLDEFFALVNQRRNLISNQTFMNLQRRLNLNNFKLYHKTRYQELRYSLTNISFDNFVCSLNFFYNNSILQTHLNTSSPINEQNQQIFESQKTANIENKFERMPAFTKFCSLLMQLLLEILSLLVQTALIPFAIVFFDLTGRQMFI